MRVTRLISANEEDPPRASHSSAAAAASIPQTNPQRTFVHTTFNGPSMLATRRETISSVTLQTQLDLLKSTGRYDCFKLKWHPIYDDHRYWPVPPHLFWDSDLGKWMEGAIYFLAQRYDPVLDRAVQEIVEDIRAAQQADGYLNLHYIVVEPGKRWTNIRDMHEMYNAGHLLEAALAHHAHYKTTTFLSVMVKYVHLMHATFGPGHPHQKRAYPGHPELELALLRLYRATGDPKAYELAHFFLHERGNPSGQHGQHYYDYEMAALRGEDAHKRPNSYPMARDYWYCQAHVPILQQPTIQGHAVRATYLLTAVADLLCLDKDSNKNNSSSSIKSSMNPLPQANEWHAALTRLWDNMVQRKMYLTGGVGAIAQWEGFARTDYFLPQCPDEGGCYAETCASIGVMMLAERLLARALDARVADVMELCLYNTVMGSMSLNGQGFTYENYLASCPDALCQRQGWFECSCCPPNVSRLFGSLGGYLWHFGGGGGGGGSSSSEEEEEKESIDDNEENVFINVHMYTTAKLEFPTHRGTKHISLQQKTNWPWESNVLFTLNTTNNRNNNVPPPPPAAAPAPPRVTIRLRVPGWSNNQYILTPTPSPSEVATLNEKTGYLHLTPSYTSHNPSFSIVFGEGGAGLGRAMQPRFIAPHPYTSQPATLSLARGPLVYCVEDVDNPWEDNHFKDVVLRLDGGNASVEEMEKEWKGEKYIALRTKGRKRTGVVGEGWEVAGSALPGEVEYADVDLIFVPYYLRGNRGGKGHMRVGLLRS